MLRTRFIQVTQYAGIHNVAQAICPVQKESLKENCLLVDESDKVIGSASKRDCHIVSKNDNILLHRAFSVFLFNTKKELLIQKRSSTKITFPGCITNTCCSHPLMDFEEEQIETNALGVKLAAIRRLSHELGVPKDELKPQDVKYLTRIIYKSLGNGTWGEHEIDYVLFVHKDININPNPEEVSEVCYISKNKFGDFLDKLKDPVTPWFNLIVQSKLRLWWDNLESLDNFIDHKTIHKLS